MADLCQVTHTVTVGEKHFLTAECQIRNLVFVHVAAVQNNHTHGQGIPFVPLMPLPVSGKVKVRR